jgi:formate dehydrogenase major subunit
VTAVEVRRANTLSAWQEKNNEEDVTMRRVLEAAPDAAE